MVLVDSSAWIEAARRGGDIATKVGLEGLLGEYEAACCGVVLFQVLGGMPEAGSRATGADVPDGLWERARDKSWRLRDFGQTIPWNDILVAAVSVSRGWRIYARHRHFDAMRDVLGLRLYESDYGGKYRSEAG